MQRPMARPPFSNLFRARSRCPPRRQRASELPHPGHRSHGTRQAVTRRTSLSLLYGSPALHQRSPVMGFALPLPLSPALGRGPQGTDRNSDLKQRLRMWETEKARELISKMLGQQHSGPLLRRNREMLPQTNEQRGNEPAP